MNFLTNNELSELSENVYTQLLVYATDFTINNDQELLETAKKLRMLFIKAKSFYLNNEQQNYDSFKNHITYIINKAQV